ncbi:hypothetical protein VL20_5423 [Microcystis panniformis FACHB-1757]|uniref:Uncharacterized protein n=1 Tax=Microcystis panniformis FACHB-1757 TaxID=1638788 RepID=A0A0K1S8F1_9CHRO|nr:hypothetical protein VL20_5423 [Microcystis panniformis FACHB-1757]
MGFAKEKNNFDSQYHPVIKQFLQSMIEGIIRSFCLDLPRP